MDNKEIIEKVAHLEEKENNNCRRLDEHNERIEKLENTYATLQKMDYRMGKVESAIEKMDSKLDKKINEENETKGKKWDKFVDYIFYSVIAILLGLLYTKLGINP